MELNLSVAADPADKRMMEPRRIRFDATIDEYIDVHERYLRLSDAGRSLRRRSIGGVALVSAGALFLMFTLMSDRSTGAILVGLVLAGLYGTLGWPLHRTIHDGATRRRLKRFLRAELDGDGPWTCEMELRPEGFWSRSGGAELTLPWRDLRSVEPAGDDLQLLFRGGVVVARARAFASAEDRAAFAAAARAAAGLSSPVTER
jgi:hypothetical protein